MYTYACNLAINDIYKWSAINDIYKRSTITVLSPSSCVPSPTSDGSAAAIVCSKEFVRRHSLEPQAVEIVGMEMRTDFPSTFNEKSGMKLVRTRKSTGHLHPECVAWMSQALPLVQSLEKKECNMYMYMFSSCLSNILNYYLLARVNLPS